MKRRRSVSSLVPTAIADTSKSNLRNTFLRSIIIPKHRRKPRFISAGGSAESEAYVTRFENNTSRFRLVLLIAAPHSWPKVKKEYLSKRQGLELKRDCRRNYSTRNKQHVGFRTLASMLTSAAKGPSPAPPVSTHMALYIWPFSLFPRCSIRLSDILP
jgi:hypothetical protein